MSVLVTGGCGYIGSNTVVELIQSNNDVILLDNFHNSSKEVVDEIEEITRREIKVYNVDLINKDKIEEIFKENDITSVVHLAGLKAISESIKDPLFYYKNNVEGTLNLLAIMEKYDVYHLIFSSSATVYGFPDSLPVKETSSREALNPYGRTKLQVEEILEDLTFSNPKWKIVSLRYFNPVGAHKSGLLAEDPNGTPTNLVPYIAKVATNELSELKVFGGDYDTEDGTGVRDYIHIEDLAKGHVAALEKIHKINGFDPFNLGTGKGYSVLEVIKAFEHVAGLPIPYAVTDRREGDIAVSFSDPTKAASVLEWKATKGILEMCNDTWEAVKHKKAEKVEV